MSATEAQELREWKQLPRLPLAPVTEDDLRELYDQAAEQDHQLDADEEQEAREWA